MKIYYIDVYSMPIYNTDSDYIPRVGEKVKLAEDLFVVDVNHVIQEKSVYITLSIDKPVTNKIVKENTSYNDNKISQLNKALVEQSKEIKSLKNKLLNVEQNIKHLISKIK